MGMIKQSLTDAALEAACAEIAQSKSCDVIIFNGHTGRKIADDFMDMVANRKRRDSVLLVLITPGGSAEAAYRVARCLQACYKHFTVLVPGWCKSAGTLCVLGANEVVMADCAELGPLDVQLAKRDEIGDSSSGLVLSEALDTLRAQAFELYEDCMLRIKQESEGLISFKTASDIAVRLAIGLSEPLFKQIDPIQVGENARSMSIARAYGERLKIRSQNFDDNGLTLLINSYPEHGFVIDRREAKEIFKRVREPDPSELAIVTALGKATRYPARPGQEYTRYLTKEISRRKHEAQAKPKAREVSATHRAARKQGNAGDSRVAEKAGGPVTAGVKRQRLNLVPEKGAI